MAYSIRRLASLGKGLAIGLLLVLPALPHHSNTAFEVEKVITITGVVKELRWSNPHTWLIVTVDEGGKKIDWGCEGRAPGVLMRAGWTRNSLKMGDRVTVDMSPAKDGSKTSLVARVTKADGTILANAPPATE